MPYGCALGFVTEATNCMLTPGLVLMAGLYNHADNYERRDKIDPLSNLREDKVFIFHGSADIVVDPGRPILIHPSIP